MVVSRASGGKLTEELTKFNVGKDAPYRMTMHPAGKSIVISLALGGIKVIKVDYNQTEGTPKMSWPPSSLGSAAAACASCGVIKCMSFSDDGTRLALGSEEGLLFVYSWPTLEKVAEMKVSKKAVRNADFSKGHNGGIVCVVDESGTCGLWSVDDSECVYSLPCPENMARASFFRCLTDVDHNGIVLYTALRYKGSGYVVRWRQNTSGEICIDRTSSRAVTPSPIAGFELSHDGNTLAAVTPDGEQCMISSETLRPIKFVKGAHMTFATAVVFTPDDRSIISVSADASATLSAVPPRQNSSSIWLMVAIITTLLLLLMHAMRDYSERHPDVMLQYIQIVPSWLRDVLLLK